MQNKRMNLRLFEDDVNIIDRTGAETLIPTQESNEIIQGKLSRQHKDGKERYYGTFIYYRWSWRR